MAVYVLCVCIQCHVYACDLPLLCRLSVQMKSEDYSVLTSTLSPLVHNSDTEQVSTMLLTVTTTNNTIASVVCKQC